MYKQQVAFATDLKLASGLVKLTKLIVGLINPSQQQSLNPRNWHQ